MALPDFTTEEWYGPERRRYWLMKSEPEDYSFEQLRADGVASWDGVRNYQARNFMRDLMKVGDGVLFYHSNAQPSGIVGEARVERAAYPDSTAWDRKGDHFDPKASPENPIWLMVDVAYVASFDHVVTLADLRDVPELEGLLVTRRGMRLSVQPVLPRHFERIRQLGR